MTYSRPNQPLIPRLFTGLIVFGILLVTIATLLAHFVPGWWISDLLSHLRFQYALFLIVPFLWWVRKRHWASFFVLIPLTLNLSVLLPLGMAPPRLTTPTTRPLHILHYNLDKSAADHRSVFAYLRDHPADILLLQEVTPDLASRFARDLQAYRLVHAHPLSNTHGSALLLPITSDLNVLAVGEVHLPAYSPRPLITATLALDGQPFTVLSLHVIRPKDTYSEAIQAAEYVEAATWLNARRAQTGYPMLVIGDYNTTPWSARFQKFLQASGLRDSTPGFGYQPTWPASMPALLAIPIDHAVVSPEVVVLDRAVGPNLGGDHAPLWVTIALPVIQ